MVCLTGCIQARSCSNVIKRGIDGENFAPYVKLFFGSGSNPEITVGNESSPQWGNTAVVKSFQYGASDGCGVTAEIEDIQGGSFQNFAEKLTKCIGKNRGENMMSVEWGWVVTFCDGGHQVIPSPRIKLLLVGIKPSWADGKITFTLEAKDVVSKVQVARHDEIEGSDDAKVPLKTAITQLANNKEPKFDVEYIRIENGVESPFKFKIGGEQGPKGKWDCDGQNKLATITKWIEPFVTDRDKGIIAVWNPIANKLTLLEDPEQGCNQTKNCGRTNIGTYIVNGGQSCSPVLSFSSDLNFVQSFGTLTKIANSGAGATGRVEIDKRECDRQTPETGILQSIPVTSYAWNIHGPRNATRETRKSQVAYTKANIRIDGPITAELKIQGDPLMEFIQPKFMKGKTVAVVFINPFHISGGGNGCGDWLAQPGCNEVLSNKNWMIEGCDHSIREGSYQTTLKLKLAGPGVEIDDGQPFGGPNSGGFKPKNTC